MVHCIDDGGRLVSRREICEGQTPKNAVVEMVVERVWQRKAHLRHNVDQLLFLDRKRDVLDDNGGRDELFIEFRMTEVG